MNREIKFRAWDRLSNEWTPLLDGVASDGQPFFIDGDGSRDYRNDEWTLCQYTGLKDKNGVEIYEGDIVKVGRKSLGNNNKEGDYRTLPIVWNDERAGWCYDSDYMRSWAAGIWTDLKVIGNVYENPELLQDNSEAHIVEGKET